MVIGEIGDELKNANNRVQMTGMQSKGDSAIIHHPNIMEIIVLAIPQDTFHVHELIVKVR